MAEKTILCKALPAQSVMRLPCSGGGSDIALGTLMMRGATGGTNKGVLIPATATSNAHCVGILGELHDYSVSGDALTQTIGNWFPGFDTQNVPSHNIDLLDTAHLIRVPYDLDATGLLCTSATGAVFSFATVEADLDGGFIYCNAGAAIGQLGFIASSATDTSITIISALTTVPSTTSYFTIILPLFYDTPTFKVNSTTVGNMIDTGSAAGTNRAVVMANKIQYNGMEHLLDPKAFHNRSKLNSAKQLDIFAEMAMVDSVFHPVQ